MTRWLQIALAASLLSAACGTTPTQPTSPAPAAPSNPPVAPALVVIVSNGPFHVGKPGEIRYEVTGVSTLASIAYSSTDGAGAFAAVMMPAPAQGALNLTYGRPGSFTATVTATTTDGTKLQVSVSVKVVE